MSRATKKAPEVRAYVLNALGKSGALLTCTIEGGTPEDREHWAHLFLAAPALRKACADASRSLGAFGIVLSEESRRLNVKAKAGGAE